MIDYADPQRLSQGIRPSAISRITSRVPCSPAGAMPVDAAGNRRLRPQIRPTADAHRRRGGGAGQFGGLIASGWHTGAMMMRLFADNFLSPASSIASPGLDELRWLLPVRPGDIEPASHDFGGAALAQPAGPGGRAQPRRGAEPARRGGDEHEADQPDALPAGAREHR